MAVTGRTTDGALVFDDTIDDRGRLVIDSVNHILQDGTIYFPITPIGGTIVFGTIP